MRLGTGSNFPPALPSPSSSLYSSVTCVSGEFPTSSQNKNKNNKEKIPNLPLSAPATPLWDTHMMGVLSLQFLILRNEMAFFFFFTSAIYTEVTARDLCAKPTIIQFIFRFLSCRYLQNAKMGSGASVNKRKDREADVSTVENPAGRLTDSISFHPLGDSVKTLRSIVFS